MEKSQDSEETAAQPGQESKGKKQKEQKAAPQQKKQFTFLPPKMTDAEVVKSLAPLKAITISTASRALGVNASVASGILRDFESKKLLRKVGGFSGHAVYAAA
jgi:small subunit ribosomal protein S25e